MKSNGQTQLRSGKRRVPRAFPRRGYTAKHSWLNAVAALNGVIATIRRFYAHPTSIVGGVSRPAACKTAVLVMLIHGTLSESALACSTEDLGFAGFFAAAEHVFQGQVHSASPDIITVEKVYKGTPFQHAERVLPEFLTSCDIEVVENESYLFFLTGDAPFELILGSGTTGMAHLPDDWRQALFNIDAEQ